MPQKCEPIRDLNVFKLVKIKNTVGEYNEPNKKKNKSCARIPKKKKKSSQKSNRN